MVLKCSVQSRRVRGRPAARAATEDLNTNRWKLSSVRPRADDVIPRDPNRTQLQSVPIPEFKDLIRPSDPSVPYSVPALRTERPGLTYIANINMHAAPPPAAFPGWKLRMFKFILPEGTGTCS